MALRKSQASYSSKIPTPPTKPKYESATLEEPIDSMISDMPTPINVPEEVLFQNYLS